MHTMHSWSADRESGESVPGTSDVTSAEVAAVAGLTVTAAVKYVTIDNHVYLVKYYFTSPSIERYNYFISPYIERYNYFTAPFIECYNYFTSPSNERYNYFTSPSIELYNYFTAPSIERYITSPLIPMNVILLHLSFQ